MNVDDVYGGPLDMATFGRPVAGPLSEDQQWLVNPLSYDPTRPPPTPIMDEDHHGETHLAADQYGLSTPIGDAEQLGAYALTTTTKSDVDISLLAELGQAVTRGSAQVNMPVARSRADQREIRPGEIQAGEVHQRWRQPTAADTAQCERIVSTAVPSTTPHTPESAIVPAVASPNMPPLNQGSRSASHDAAAAIADTCATIAEAGTDVALSAIMATAGTYGGGLAGAQIGGDIAVANLGPLAEPFGQAIGRNLGRLAGGTSVVAAIRCTSRSGVRSSCSRSSSQVRFAPDIPLRVNEAPLVTPNGTVDHAERQISCTVPAAAAAATTSEEILLAIQVNAEKSRADTSS
jgi:hypothetical protein